MLTRWPMTPNGGGRCRESTRFLDRRLRADDDLVRLTQAIGNPLHNAAMYDRHGNIRTTVLADDSDLVIMVSGNDLGYLRRSCHNRWPSLNPAAQLPPAQVASNRPGGSESSRPMSWRYGVGRAHKLNSALAGFRTWRTSSVGRCVRLSIFICREIVSDSGAVPDSFGTEATDEHRMRLPRFDGRICSQGFGVI
ncbi:hypothetical protein AWB81_06055 [Caballeronia arationis]|uniref:hypothetical protein n=1 Tax=Caballeronia arationis TaxID=1777142 RepID=UPI00074BA0E5|nr:hypothetical protein [Caballeronia arationis]SAL01482.1 hypothetical protein AWB81_06055 [Caballeronia arationis]